jgi:hypothetical protein
LIHSTSSHVPSIFREEIDGRQKIQRRGAAAAGRPPNPPSSIEGGVRSSSTAAVYGAIAVDGGREEHTGKRRSDSRLIGTLNRAFNIVAAGVRSPFGEVIVIGRPLLSFFLSSDEANQRGARPR